MGKKRGRPKATPEGGREGKPLHVYLKPQLMADLLAFLAGNDPQISKTAYVSSLIRADLRARGKLTEKQE